MPGRASLERRLGAALEVVDVRAGEVAARAGVPGRWRTLVARGTVATTCPPRRFSAGDVLVHGPGTAVLAVTDCRLLTVDDRHELAPLLGRSAAEPGSAAARLQIVTADRRSHAEQRASGVTTWSGGPSRRR